MSFACLATDIVSFHVGWKTLEEKVGGKLGQNVDGVNFTQREHHCFMEMQCRHQMQRNSEMVSTTLYESKGEASKKDILQEVLTHRVF